MKQAWTRTWKSSVQPRKQRKYIANAPLHIARKFCRSHLSKELRAKYKKRSLLPVKGDTVQVLRGKFKGAKGKIEGVKVKKQSVFVTGIEKIKKDGNKVRVPIKASNLLITGLNLNDEKRRLRIEGKK